MRWLVVLALLLPLPLAGVVSARMADVAGKAVGARLDRVVATALLAPPLEPAPYAVVPDNAVAGVVFATTPKRAHKHITPSPKQAVRVVFVSASVVLRLANRGVRPRGVPVAARGSRPAGLLLAGVGALGIGLQDGDVLTHAAGAPVLDIAGVVSAVLSARGRGAKTIGGRFWRGAEEWQLVVEQPYPSAMEPGRASVEHAQPGRKRGA